MNEITEPTSKQCSEKEVLWESETQIAWATYYPQMGGYGSKAVIVGTKQPSEYNECFDAYIWHDGEFPFDGESGNKPRELHHCMAQQFIRFGEEVLKKSYGKNQIMISE